MLNYADLQRIYRLEKNTSSLQKIPDNFYFEVKLLLSKIGDEHKAYLKKLVSEIQEKRKNKLLIQAMREEEMPANAIPVEREVYQQVMGVLEEYHNKVSPAYEKPEESGRIEEKIRKEKKQEVVEKKSQRLKLKILKPLPEMIGPNYTSYGPFSEGEEVELPEKMAKILLKREVAKKI